MNCIRLWPMTWWEWYENGTNVLDAFKSYSADTFRSIGKEMVKQLVNTLLFDQLKENMQALLTGYSLDAAAGQKSEEQLTQELMAGTQLQTENLLNQAKVVAPVLQNAVQTWEEGMERMGLSTEESFENVFSSIKDNFKSMLLDMESDATDFGKQLKKAMYEALLERFVMKAPVTVTIDGEQQTFDSLNSYLDNWQKRANEVAQTMSATEHDTQKSSLEEQIAALEAERKANLEARQPARNRGGLQSQYDSLYNQYGYLLRGGTAKTEEEIKAKERLLAMQEELAKRSAEYDERNTEILAKIRDLRSQLAEIEASETLTDEERAAKIAELNAELEEQLAISKQIAKTYADMAGWTMEMKIDASPLASLGDELLSVLQDTSKGVDDWKKELVEAMTNDLIKEVVYNADFEKSIRDLQEQYVNIMSSDMSAEEKAAAIQKIADAIAALYNTADEKVDGLKNIIPDIDTSPFDNLRDTILDTFTDIEADAKDFRKSLEKTLVKDLLEKMVLDVPLTVTIDGEDKTFDGGFDEYGKDWNKRYIAAVKALQEARKTGNAEAIAEAQAAVDALFDEVEGVYTQLEEGADEFMKRLKEIANDTTFTDMADSLVSSLMDVEGDIADIADDMKKTIVQKLIEAFMVCGQIKPLLEDLQETFNAVMGMDGLTPEQRAQMMRTGFAGTDAEGNAKTFIGIDDESVTQRLSSWQATVRAIMEGIGYSVEGAAGLFDNLGDTILDSLMNTEGGVKDFMQNISETIARELMESYMATEEFQEGLKTVKDDLEAAVKALAEAKTPEEIAAAEEQLKNAKKAAEDFYNEAVGGTKRFTDALKKIENDTTFKDMTGNWVSNLMDFNATAEDWAEEIGQTMAQKIIEQMIVPTMIQPLLDNIQKAFNDAMATNTTSDAEGNAVYNWKGVLNDEGLKASITALQDAYPELKDVVQQILSLSGVKPDFSNSLDSLGDTLLDRLLSLDDDVEDIGKQIGQTLIREMLEQMLSTGQYADRIAAIKKMWQAILTGEDTEHTIEDVLKDIEQLENDITNPENSDFSGLIAKYKSLADVAKEGFSDLRGAFLSSLIDMNGDAETFGKSIGRTMLEQMLDAYVKRTYKEQIAAINKEWAEALQSGNTDALERIKQKVQELYSTISTDVEVSNIADAIKELDKQLDTTFSDMADSWTSTLMDMEATAEDWAQSVGKIIAEKIIKSMVIPAIIQPILDTMQKAWNAAAEQEGATYQTMLDAMMPYLSDLVGAYEELRPIADYILNSLGVYKETVEELKEEVEYALQDMKDNFVSDLMDMEATAEKRAESISRIIAENFIKNFVLGDAFDAQMEQWQQHYESIIHSGLSEDERARQLKLLRDAIASAKEGYVEQALAIQELLGLNAASSDQTATTNMADKITYEQADQLLGVNMAQEMTLEQILATLRGSALTASGSAYLPTGIGTTPAASETAQQIEASLRNLNSLSQPDSDTVREIRGLILIGNTYLYDIKESNAQILRQFGERLDTICSRLATF